jgi:hypothetical protein
MESTAGTEAGMNAAYRALWTCTGTFRKTWRLKPKVLYCIYTMVVRPIITYATIMWWPRVKYRTSWAKLFKQEKLACPGTTGAVTTVPAAAVQGTPSPSHEDRD